MPFDVKTIDLTFLVNHSEVVLTFIWAFAALSTRWYVKRTLRNNASMELDKKRQRLNTIDNVFNMLLVVGLILIWSSELQNLAFSIAAFMVALVIATKEFIQCIMGAFFKASTRPFRVGDWVRIGSFEGEVTDSDWLTTTLFDVDLGADTYSYTGRTSVIPNSMLLTSTVQNLNFMRRYVAHTFSITRHSAKVNLFEMRDPILTRIHEYSAHFRDVAIRYNNLIEKRLDIKMPSPEPSVRITTTHDGHDVFTVTLFCPTQEAAQIEQKITEDFMALWFELATRSSVS